MSQSNDERRSAPRQVLRTRAKLLFKEGLQLDVRTLNLSASGMGIVSDGPLAPGLTFALRCHVPANGAKAELTVQARVVHSVFSSAEGGFSVGLTFVGLSPEAARLIAGVMRPAAKG